MISGQFSGDRLILASKSPRRKELLGRICNAFDCVTLEVDELKEHPEGSDKLALHNAVIKAQALSAVHPDAWVIGSDTVVSFQNQSLGKPADRNEAFQMITQLSGRSHQVFSGVCLIHENRGVNESFVVESGVQFFELSEQQIHDYLDHYDATQFAGAYPIQHVLGSIVAGFDGSYTNIVGLPVERLSDLLKSHQII